MATIINNPGETVSAGENSALGLVVGLILAVLLIVLFFVYAVPAIRNSQTPAPPADTNIEVNIPNPLNNPPPANSPTSPSTSY